MKKLILISLLIGALPLSMVAQDDDLYFVPKKKASVEKVNDRHNAVINRVDDRFTSLLGDVSILKEIDGTFDLVMANINRNILLADMPAMKAKMAPGARLILSGFYTNDIPMLTDKARSLGLTLITQQEDNNWACLVFQN